MSKQSALHFVGALAFFYGAWCHMGAAQRLYLPGENMPKEDTPGYDEAAQLVEAAEASLLLQHPGVKMLVWFRHIVLMRAPLAVFIVPIFSQLAERTPMPEAAGGVVGPGARSMMGLAQWLIVLNFALIFISYGPELSIACLLPVPVEEE